VPFSVEGMYFPRDEEPE